MTAFGPSVAQSVAGVQQAATARLRANEKEKASERVRDKARKSDEVELSVDQVELAEAVRNLKKNADEEAHEDREQRVLYKPRTNDRRHVDLEG